ncbi:MAG: hypothetical protein KKB50_06415 [Planctomycetes bacterium]|nr:hypothetical protein [Planctomycetota bacterium]
MTGATEKRKRLLGMFLVGAWLSASVVCHVPDRIADFFDDRIYIADNGHDDDYGWFHCCDDGFSLDLDWW